MKATILLAEDERDMREVLCDYFTAKSGGELTMISAPDGNTGAGRRAHPVRHRAGG